MSLTRLVYLPELMPTAWRADSRTTNVTDSEEEHRARRARIAAFEASDHASRIAKMNREHRAVAARLAADYGFEPPKPPTAEDLMKAQLARKVRAQMISHLGRLDSFTALGCRSRDDR